MILIYLFFSIFAHATITPDYPRGEAIINHEVPDRKPEICVIPKHLPIGKYTTKDTENESELCQFNIGVNIAACGKENSTNPGVLFMLPPKGEELSKYIKSDCTLKNSEGEDGEKEAKYKLSTSCSYTPSLLAYYHVSRALGNILNIPVAVVRTMDLERHIAIGNKSINDTTPGDTIHETWKSLMKHLLAGSKSSKANLLFTDGFDQTYGALQKNPKKEAFYKEFFNKGDDRAAAFRDRNPIYRSLTNPKLLVPREFSQENVQALVQLRDAADFILIDTLLSQEDRFGNIHYKNAFYYYLSENGKFDVKSTKDKKDIPADALSNAVEVKEMILKDNDCGVTRENRAKNAGLLDQVSHIAPSTYKNLMKLENIIDLEETKKLFTRGMIFTESDFKSFVKNLHESAKALREGCKTGRVRLDLSLDTHFSAEPLPTKYECEP